MSPSQTEPKVSENWIATLRNLLRHGVVRAFIGVLISVIFIKLFLQHIDSATVFADIRHMSPAPIALALALLAGGYSLRISRWRYMIRSLGISVSFFDVARAFMASNALNNLLPLRAGDVARVVVFAKDIGTQPSFVTGTLMIERLFDVVMLLIIFFTVLSIIPANLLPPTLIKGAQLISVAATVVAICALLLPRRLRGLLVRFFGLPSGHVVINFADGLLATLQTLCKPRTLTLLFMFSAGGWLLEGAYYAAMAAAFNGFALPLAGAYTCLALGTLSTFVPSAPGYVGTFHYFVSLGLVAFGLSASDGAAYAFVTHGIAWMAITSVGLILMFVHRPAHHIKVSVPDALSHIVD